jgi:hypothetical protein
MNHAALVDERATTTSSPALVGLGSKISMKGKSGARDFNGS